MCSEIWTLLLSLSSSTVLEKKKWAWKRNKQQKNPKRQKILKNKLNKRLQRCKILCQIATEKSIRFCRHRKLKVHRTKQREKSMELTKSNTILSSYKSILNVLFWYSSANLTFVFGFFWIQTMSYSSSKKDTWGHPQLSLVLIFKILMTHLSIWQMMQSKRMQ